ncbi:MAG: C10 family peptidase, partial [Bacteroidales bacterium]|nr:C10 family peptidase [Bacteroidales bacterium]
MKRKIFIYFGLAVIFLRVQSQPVSIAEAEQVARHFFGKTHKSLQNCVSISVRGEDTLLYVFNADKGFVVVSGEKKAIPILAYSTESNYDAEHVIPPVKMWMDNYQRQLFALRQDATQQQSISISKAWKELQTFPKTHKSTTSPATPLITSKWGQGKMYNYYCPKDEESNNNNNNNNKRAVTGCVATTMAQLMYYFRYPEKGTGTYLYTHDVYGAISADFEDALYDYSAMVETPDRINPAISLLMSHCGIAVDMQYGPVSSGMYNHKAAYALKTYFNFSPQTQYVFRDSTSLDWDSLIVAHLDNKIPLYYAGWSVPNIEGHAFICDAYQMDSNNGNHYYYYHFNFGWDGYLDGYFFTDTLSPNGNNFNLAQELIVNAFPDTLKLPYPLQPPLTGTTTLTAEAGSFTDGTIYDCPPNMNYTWIIQPDVDRITKIQFSLRYNLEKGDTLFVT